MAGATIAGIGYVPRSRGVLTGIAACVPRSMDVLVVAGRVLYHNGFVVGDEQRGLEEV